MLRRLRALDFFFNFFNARKTRLTNADFWFTYVDSGLFVLIFLFLGFFVCLFVF